MEVHIRTHAPPTHAVLPLMIPEGKRYHERKANVAEGKEPRLMFGAAPLPPGGRHDGP